MSAHVAFGKSTSGTDGENLLNACSTLQKHDRTKVCYFQQSLYYPLFNSSVLFWRFSVCSWSVADDMQLHVCFSSSVWCSFNSMLTQYCLLWFQVYRGKLLDGREVLPSDQYSEVLMSQPLALAGGGESAAPRASRASWHSPQMPPKQPIQCKCEFKQKDAPGPSHCLYTHGPRKN